MKKIRILHYAPGFLFGGIESRLLDWYRAIDRTKIQFELLKTTTQNDTSIIKEFEALGGVVHNIAPFTPLNILKHITEIKSFFNKNSDFQILHSHALMPFVIKEAKRIGIKTRILHSRAVQFNPDEKGKILKNLFKNHSKKYATHLFACSGEAAEWGFGRSYRNAEIIKNGIEVDKFIFNLDIRHNLRKQNGLEGKFVIGFVGRFSKVKNIDFLIEVFSKIHKLDTNSILLLIGDGPEKENLLKKTKDFNIEDNVIFMGQKENVYDYFQVFDVFVMPSLYEGFGTTAIEAQASGLITILSNTIPKSVKVTNLVRFISLEQKSDFWAKEIIKYNNNYSRENTFEQISNAGYNNMQTAKELQDFYLKNSFL